MDEQIKSIALQLLEQVKQGTDFIIGQLPDVANQIIIFKFWESTFWLCFCVFLSIVFLVLGILSWKAEDKISSATGGWAFMGFVLFIAAALTFFIGVACYIPEMIKLKTAPKLYLIEYLSKLAGLSN